MGYYTLCGLKQAGRQWNQKLSTTLISLGYTQSKANHSLFVKSSNTSNTVLLVYVDDLVLAGNNMAEISVVINLFDSQFRIIDLGALRVFLGLEVTRSKKRVILNKRKYTLEILDDSGVLTVKPSTIPSDPSVRLSSQGGNLYPDQFAYRGLIGRLLDLAYTRPGITFSI